MHLHALLYTHNKVYNVGKIREKLSDIGLGVPIISIGTLQLANSALLLMQQLTIVTITITKL